MKKIALICLLFGSFAISARSQTVAPEILVKKIEAKLESAPHYLLSTPPPQTDPSARWLVVEAELESKPDWADDVQIKFYVVANYGPGAKVESTSAEGFDILSGSTTVVNMQGNRSSGKKIIVPVFLDAKTVKKYGAAASVQQFIPQVAVQVFYKGVLQDTQWMSSLRKGDRFWETKQPRNGVLTILTQSPWFPAFAEYYEQVRSPTPVPQ